VSEENKRIPEIELLRAQVLHQKALNAALQVQLTQILLQQHETRRATLLAELEVLRKDIATRHGINLDTHVILEETGVVIPRSSVAGMSDLAKLLQGAQGA